jgi:hypothetical protein
MSQLTRAQLLAAFAQGPAGADAVPLVEQALHELGWGEREAFSKGDMTSLNLKLVELGRAVMAQQSPKLVQAVDTLIQKTTPPS